MTTAIGTYLVQRYGGRSVATPNRSRSLSRMHEHLAKSLLLENLEGDISIEQVAQACNLSRGYFIRAFRETTGMTPYQWLVSQRIDRARTLLRTSNAPLAEVAIAQASPIKVISQGFSPVSLAQRLAIGGETYSPAEQRAPFRID